MSTFKNEPKMKSFKCNFQGCGPHFLKIFTSETCFCKEAISVEHIPVAIFVFCVPCELEISNPAVFFKQHPQFFYIKRQQKW